eukprot:TRINITY_DN54564_c0_g1_i1.p2 TRINITY_DN54564_c0_g1~~TRINITY_DN54564_c0_g1_i1.p2  ORF type:complete len:156 (+),score=33.91 TRINITY_DN54564_c0_g1_i1:89-556(+)
MIFLILSFCFFFFNDTATTEIYTRSIVGSVRCVQETGINAEYMGSHLLCPICKDFLVYAVSTPCGHMFCEWCIFEWHLNRGTCPVCRASIGKFNTNQCPMMDQIIAKCVENEASEKELSLIHISEPTRPLYISYAVFCLKKKKTTTPYTRLIRKH